MGRRVHVLVAVNEGARSGGPLSALELVRLLRDLDYRVTVVTRRTGPLIGSFRAEADDVIDQPGGRLVPWLDRIRFRGVAVGGGYDRSVADRVLESVDPDLVIAETVVCAEWAGAARRAGKPSLLKVHEHPPDLDTWLTVHGGPEDLRDIVLVANSHATARAVAQRFGRSADDVPVVYPPVSTDLVGDDPEDVPTGRTSHCVLGVGVVAKLKGSDLFVEIARGTVADRPDTIFRWVGEGPLLRSLRGTTRGTPVVQFPGRTDRIDSEYGAATVVLIPSRVETFSRVAVESLAHGVPVVASDVGGLPEAVGPGGILTTPTVEALTGAVRRLLDDPGLRAELVRNGQAWISERYGLDVFRETMEPIIRRLTAELEA